MAYRTMKVTEEIRQTLKRLGYEYDTSMLTILKCLLDIAFTCDPSLEQLQIKLKNKKEKTNV